jgi:hypothetical protein
MALGTPVLDSGQKMSTSQPKSTGSSWGGVFSTVANARDSVLTAARPSPSTAASDWLQAQNQLYNSQRGTLGTSTALSNQLSNQYYAGRSGYLGTSLTNDLALLDADRYRNVTLAQQGIGNDTSHITNVWDNLQSALSNQQGDARAQWSTLRNYLDQQGVTTDRAWELLGGYIQQQGGTINKTYQELEKNFYNQMETTGTTRRIQEWLNAQNVAHNTTQRDLSLNAAQLMYDESRRNTLSDATARGARASRGTALDLDDTTAKRGQAQGEANLAFQSRKDSLSADAQTTRNTYQSAVDALNHYLATGKIDWEAGRNSLSYQYNTGENDYQAALNSLAYQKKSGQNDFNATMNGITNQWNVGNENYQYGLNGLNTNAAALKSLGNTYDIRGDQLRADSGQARNDNARAATSAQQASQQAYQQALAAITAQQQALMQMGLGF